MEAELIRPTSSLRFHWKSLRLPRWLIDRRVVRSARGLAVAAGGEAGGAREIAIVMIAATVSPLPPVDPVAQRQALLQAFLASQRSTGPSSDLLIVSASVQQTNERRRDGKPRAKAQAQTDQPSDFQERRRA